MSTPHRFTDAQELEMAKEYETDSLNVIAAKWNCHPASVWKIFKRRGVKVRSRREGILLRAYQPVLKNTLNAHAFDAAEESDEASYFLGLLLTDGCVSWATPRNVVISLGQAEDNKDIVEKFRTFLGSSAAISVIPSKVPERQTTYFFAVRSVYMATVLATYGVVSRKTGKQTVDPRLADNRHFWRGVLDGDGNLQSEPKAFIRFGSTSPLLMGGWERFARTVTGATTQIYDRPLDSGLVERQMVVNGSDAVKLASLLYLNHTVSIDRKQRIAEEIINNPRS